MGVLAGGGNADGAGPVVVEMSQLVGQLLEVLGGQTRGVLDTNTSTKAQREERSESACLP